MLGFMLKTAFLVLLSLALSGFAAASPVRVLILDGFSNHDWKRNTEFLVDILDDPGQFEVTVATLPASTPDFGRHDVVIQTCNNLNKAIDWSDATRAALVAFIRNGGGMLVYHAGNNSFKDWPEYNRLIGLGWRDKNFGKAIMIEDGRPVIIAAGKAERTGHGPRRDALVHRLGDHPIHTDLPRAWLAADLEVYRYARGPAKDLTVLSHAVDEKTGLNFPVSWLVNYGEGRVHISTYGHLWKNQAELPPGMRCEAFRLLLRRSLLFLAKRDPSSIPPTHFPTRERVSLSPLKAQ